MPRPLENFGRNVCLSPRTLVVPGDVDAVLGCLNQFRGRSIRAIGSLHAWSRAAAGDDVVLDLRRLTGVAVTIDRDGRACADVEAGCTIDRLLDYVSEHGRYTLPTYGIIGKQTVAGAIATATHGSGRSSLSHYVDAIRVAAYDSATGCARLYHWTGGEALRAARCGLGCTGIVVGVRLVLENDYLIDERTQWFTRLEQVLSQQHDEPLQQFFLIPSSWRWFARLRRRAASGTGPTANAAVQRLFRFVGVDVALNGTVRLLTWWTWQTPLRWLYRTVFPLIARSGVRVVDRARHLLMMRHDLFRHVELELFVPAQCVVNAAALLEWVLRRCDGDRSPLPGRLAHDDIDAAIEEKIGAAAGVGYVVDYPITFRRVLRDDTLISMTSGEADAWFAISLITYRRDLRSFLAIGTLLAETMATAYGARPHWGKVCPLDRNAIERLYPALPRFCAVCREVDRNRAFVNDFAHGVLGL